MSDPSPFPLRPPLGQNFHGGHAKWGAPIETYCYEDTEGPLFYVCQYSDSAEGEQRVATWSWVSRDWKQIAPLKPRPLYRLDQIQIRSSAPVLLVGSERCADAAGRVMRETVVATWHGGLSHIGVADWTPLAKRQVNIWPTAQEDAWEAATKIAGWLLQLDCKVGIVDTHGQPAGWDLADAIQEGWKLADILAYARDRKRPITRPQPSLRVATPIAQTGPDRPKANGADHGNGAAAEAAVDLADGPPPDDDSFSFRTLHRQYDLAFDGAGKPHINVDNVIRVIAKHPGTWSNVWYDEFLQKVMSRVDGEPREWTDVDTLKLMLWFQRSMGFAKLGQETVHAAIHLYAHGRKRNEAREWLRSLQWDGVERLPQLLPRGFGTLDNDYARAVGRCFIMGMAQRILKPGCKLDNLPVFEGAEGIFKSTALEVIGGPYYTTTHERVGDKDFYLVFPGKMLIEISELNSFSSVEVERVKGVVSTATDRYRTPYGRSAADHPRMCVFAATTNVDDWNKSDTGARRMWPVTCGVIDVSWLRQYREQLFAEAVSRLNRSELWYDVPLDHARKEQAMRHVGDLFEEALAYYLNTREEVTIPSCLESLGLHDKDKWTPKNQSRVAAILRRAGFISTRVSRQGSIVRTWRRRLPAQKPEPEQPEIPPHMRPLDF